MAVRESRTILTAEDQTRSAFASYQKGVNDCIRQTEAFRNTLMELTGIVSVGAFAALIKGSIDAAEHLLNLSKSTNIAVEDLAGLNLLAKQSGTDLDGLAKGIDRMSVAMGKAPDKFRALGITAKDNTGAFKQFADIFNLLPDIQQRNALAQAVFSKSWAEMAPALSLGGQKIGEIIEKGKALSGITQEMADRAKEFNDKWIELTGTGGLLARLVGPMLPLLILLADDMLAVQKQSQGTDTSFKPLLETLRAAVILGGNVAFVFKAIGTEIGGLAAQFVAFASGDFAGAGAIHDRMVKDAEDSRTAFDAWEKKILAVGVAEQKTGEIIAFEGGRAAITNASASASASARAAAFLAVNKESIAASASLVESLEKELLKITDISKADLKYQEVLLQIDKLKKEGKKVDEEERIILLAKEIDLKKKLIEQDAFLDAEHKKDIEAIWKQGDALEALANSWADETEKLQEKLQNEVAVMGLSNLDREKALLLIKKNQDLIAAGHDAATIRDINQAYADQIKLLESRAAIQKQIDMWDQLATAAGNFFGDLVMNGKSAFDSLKKEVKSFIQQMIALFAQRWILQMAGVATGSGVLLNAAASTGSNSLAGTALSSAGNYIGTTAVGGMAADFYAGYAGSTLAAGEAGATTVGAAGAMGVGADAGVLASGIMDALAAIPVWGWIAIAAIAAYAYFGGKGGGPKQGGSFSQALDASGNILSSQSPGTGYDQSITAADPQMLAFGTAMGTSFFDTLKKLGGTVPGGVSFGMNLETDPNGTAASQLGGRVLMGGSTIYSTTRDIGRDSANIAPEMQLESSRMILAALQSSQLPKDIADILNSLVASSATQDQINAIMGSALEMKGVLDALAALNLKGLDVAALKGFANSGETLAQTMQRVTGAYSQFVTAFTSDAQKLQYAQDAVAGTFKALGLAVPADNAAFLALVQGIDLSTEAGRTMFSTLIQIAPAFQTVTNAAASMLQSFDQIMSGLKGGNYMKPVLQSQLDSLVGQFQSSTGVGAGMSTGDFEGNLGNVTRDQFSAVGTVFGPAAQALALQIMQTYAQLQGLGSGNNSPVAQVSSGFQQVAQASSAVVNAFGQAQDGIKAWLSGIFLNQQLSPLTPAQQLDFAHTQYVENLLHAQQGDAGAAANYGQTANAYLTAAQAYDPGTAYTSIFAAVTRQGLGLAGGDTGPLTSASYMQGINNLRADLLAVRMAIADLSRTQAASSKDTAAEIGRIVSGAREVSM